MPRRPGIRDDDVLARLADIERRLDQVEAKAMGSKRPDKAKE